ncbi:MAG: hypothetical protein M3Q57_10000 [Pseudomonadota bacterium]|nr:hypothetical protein [Pseudomonadota bacterium]
MSILLALAAALQAQAPLLEIPRAFWGEYNTDLADCGTGLNDSRLRISWNMLQFYESTGTLREMIRNRDGSVTLLADHAGEGERWTSLYQLGLSPDGKWLTATHPQDAESQQSSMKRQRCPVAGK